MTELDDFLAEVLPKLHHTETSLHNGDAGPRVEMWSVHRHADPYDDAAGPLVAGLVSP